MKATSLDLFPRLREYRKISARTLEEGYIAFRYFIQGFRMMSQHAIWKFSLPVRAEPAIVPMPIGAHIISVQPQRDQFCFWAIVDPSQDRVERRFIWIATGQTFASEVIT